MAAARLRLFSPFQGSLIDRFGARKLIAIGTPMAISWIPASMAPREMLKQPLFWLIFIMMTMRSMAA
jgi:hypothetical protein